MGIQNGIGKAVDSAKNIGTAAVDAAFVIPHLAVDGAHFLSGAICKTSGVVASGLETAVNETEDVVKEFLD